MKIEEPKYFIDVLLPLPLANTYTYKITKSQYNFLREGFRVGIPFGKQKVYTGIISQVHKIRPQNYDPKPIFMIMDNEPLVTKTQLMFWEWISSYYMCTQGEVLKASLPGALIIESQSVLVKCEADQDKIDALTDTQYIVYEALQKQNLSLEEVGMITELKHVMPLVMDMIKKKCSNDIS